MNGKRLYEIEYAAHLFDISKGDLESAKALAKTTQGRPENIVFLAQQSIEKAIKAVLTMLRIPFPLVHDLGVLVALLPDEHCPPGGFDLMALNPYAAVKRYQVGPTPITKEEVDAALEAGDEIIKWAKAYRKQD